LSKTTLTDDSNAPDHHFQELQHFGQHHYMYYMYPRWDAKIPAATGQQTSGSRDSRHFTPDDEDAYEQGNFFNPDTPHHPH
jgi:hypothetical protein